MITCWALQMGFLVRALSERISTMPCISSGTAQSLCQDPLAWWVHSTSLIAWCTAKKHKMWPGKTSLWRNPWTPQNLVIFPNSQVKSVRHPLQYQQYLKYYSYILLHFILYLLPSDVDTCFGYTYFNFFYTYLHPSFFCMSHKQDKVVSENV